MKTAARVAKILTFTACRDIQNIPGTNPPEYVLVAPSINWWSVVYPAIVQMGLYAELTEAEGAYVPRIELHDASGEVLGCLLEGCEPLVSRDPVAVHTLALALLRFSVPKSGLYDIVLFLNDEEAARRQLWVQPPRRMA